MNLLSRKTMSRILTAAIVILLASLCVGSVTAAEEIPPFPVQVWGSVTINGEPAPVGSIITAKIGDKVLQSFELSESGKMGSGGTFGEKFVLTAGSDDINKEITFWMGTMQAQETVMFSPGDASERSLTFSAPANTVSPTQASTQTPPVSSTPAQNTIRVVTPRAEQVTEVSSVMLQSKNTAEGLPANIQVVVSPLTQTVAQPSANAYTLVKTMDITVENAPSSGVSGTLTFTIPRSSVTRPANVVMLHYQNGVWSELATSLVSLSGDGSSVKYSAETPAFSPFAIVEKVIADPPADPSSTQTAETSVPTSSGPVQTVQTNAGSIQTQTTPASTPGFGLLIGGLGIVGAVCLRRYW